MSGFERWSKARRARIIAFDDIAEDRLIRAGAILDLDHRQPQLEHDGDVRALTLYGDQLCFVIYNGLDAWGESRKVPRCTQADIPQLRELT